MASKTNYEAFYHAFRDISKLVHSGKTLREVLQRVVWKSTEVLNAKGALLRVLNPASNQFEVAAAYGLGELYLSKGPVSTEKIVSDLNGPDRVVVIEDIWKAPRVEYPQAAWDEGVRMMLDVPLTLEEQIIGIIRIYLSEHRNFCEEEKSFMVYIAEQSACAINQVRFIENQRVRYDQLALQTEKMSALGRLAAGIAHEINNPLAGILLFSTNLRKKVQEQGPLKEGLDVIIREAIRCKTIIQELLEFSRNREPRMVPSDINEIIKKALSILENEFRLQRIQVSKNLTTQIEKISLDENQVEQVLVNILLNAIQATPGQGKITVKSDMNSKRNIVKVVISDTGCGIAPQHLSKIFEPFFSTKEKGTGLGLAVSYGIVKNHQGNIEVASQPGKGACFTITFPRHKESSQGKTR